jgi:hypothetical protein
LNHETAKDTKFGRKASDRLKAGLQRERSLESRLKPESRGSLPVTKAWPPRFPGSRDRISKVGQTSKSALGDRGRKPRGSGSTALNHEAAKDTKFGRKASDRLKAGLQWERALESRLKLESRGSLQIAKAWPPRGEECLPGERWA